MALKDYIKTGIEVVRDFNNLVKAKTEDNKNPTPQGLPQKATEDPKTLFFDPYAVIDQLGYKDKPSSITYGTLWQMFMRMPVIQSIVILRKNQIANFAKPQQDKYELGFKVALRDEDKNPTKQELKWAQEMSNTLMTTGATNNPKGRDSFRTFLKKLVSDTLIYDQMCFEIVKNRKGLPAEWYATDATTIRIADNGNTFIDEDLTKEIRYVQIYDGIVINEYTADEMVFGVRNPNTNIRLQGYGVSELELLITTITGLLNAHDFNAKFFTQGSTAKGIINFKGTVPNKQLAEFRRHWYNLLSGASSSWRTPIMNSEDLQYVNLQQSHRDMEFNAWMDFLIKEACAVFGTDPAEINFKYGNTGQDRSLVESSSADKITESKERGLRPLLDDIAELISTHIVTPLNEDFCFKFCGLDSETKDKVVERNMKRVKSYLTVDELRAEEDRPPLPDKQGEIILDPIFLQNKNAGSMGGGGFGEEGGDTGENGEDEQDIGKLLSQYGGAEDEDNKDSEDTEKGFVWGDSF